MAFWIRQDQFEVLERDVGIAELQRDVIRRLGERSPGCFAIVPERAIAAVTRLGVERAARRGLTRVGPVRLFVEMMILFGSAFDDDPLFPWAEAVLVEAHPTQGQKADRLHDAMMEYLRAVPGIDQERTLAAMRRFEPIATRVLSMDVSPEAMREVILRETRALSPERLGYLGPAGEARAVDTWARLAEAHGLRGGGAVVYALLACLLGHGFATDPLFAWADTKLRGGDMQAIVGEAGLYCERILRFMHKE
ncbi:hypothetical protein [Polyangium sp. y55x31]|uniref:hypothetical protein n=1 Tax=Polyangium sp. y55x31 TaxID=3042688 RepID=UPI00248259BB|nr:hypothetical protein [Polyangium sp. y55x31]MDI1480916.1 hypothetical protein [Polyangium sp. y55x31]